MQTTTTTTTTTKLQPDLLKKTDENAEVLKKWSERLTDWAVGWGIRLGASGIVGFAVGHFVRKAMS